MASKKAEMIVKHCHALMYDAIHERIKDLVEEFRSSRGWTEGQPNEHKFKVGNCVQLCGVHNGYVVRVTPKFVFDVTEPDIFKSQPCVCVYLSSGYPWVTVNPEIPISSYSEDE